MTPKILKHHASHTKYICKADLVSATSSPPCLFYIHLFKIPLQGWKELWWLFFLMLQLYSDACWRTQWGLLFSYENYYLNFVSNRNYLAHGKWKLLSNSSFNKYPGCHDSPPPNPSWKTTLATAGTECFAHCDIPRPSTVSVTEQVWMTVYQHSPHVGATEYFPGWPWLSSGQKNKGISDVHHLQVWPLKCPVQSSAFSPKTQAKASESVQPESGRSRIPQTAGNLHHENCTEETFNI